AFPPTPGRCAFLPTIGNSSRVGFTDEGRGMRRSVVAVVVGAAVLGGAAPSGAQSPSYGGGLLPAASPPRGYHPTMGIVLQPRGAAIALRFDTSILCGRQSYQPAGRATVPFDGRTFLASKRGRRISLV